MWICICFKGIDVRLAGRQRGGLSTIKPKHNYNCLPWAATDRISYNEEPAGTYKSGGQSNSLHTTLPFSFIQHHGDGSVSKDWSVLGRGYGDNVEHSRLFTGSKSYIFFPSGSSQFITLWLAIQSVSAHAAVCISEASISLPDSHLLFLLPLSNEHTRLKDQTCRREMMGSWISTAIEAPDYFLCAVCTLWGQMEDLEEHPFSIFTLRLWLLFFSLWVCHMRWIQN